MHDFCHACQLGKHATLLFPSSASRTTKPFDLVISVLGFKYYLVILDDFSHYLWISLLRLKSDTFTTMANFFCLCIYLVRLHHSKCPVRQREGIRQYIHTILSTLPRCPAAHVMPIHLLPHKMVKLSTLSAPSIMLFARCYPKLLNCLPTKTINTSRPYVALFGSPPSYEHLHVFGYACYLNLCHIPKQVVPVFYLVSFTDIHPITRDTSALDLSTNRIIVFQRRLHVISINPITYNPCDHLSTNLYKE
jgi:hypothetical protein